jgi:uncharacterized protein (TIGR02594 family)
MSEPRWLTHARQYIGVAEIPGAKSDPWIKAMWLKLKGGAWFWKTYGEDDSRLPWCGGFAAYCMDACQIPAPKNYASASGWLDWGVPLPQAMVGCVVVFTRNGGGHVGFVVGKDKLGNLLVLGGNQGDKVSIRAFPLARVAGYRWPEPGPALLTALPVLSGAALSTSEA